MPAAFLAIAPLPVWLALTAAALFGLQAVLARQAMQTVDAQTGAMTTIIVAGLAFWAIAPWYIRAEFFSTPALWIFLVNGLFHPALSMMFSFEANRRMGATMSSTIAGSTPLFATAGAVLWLGEGLTGVIALGTAGIVMGGVVLAWRRGGAVGSWPLWVLVFPLGAAVVRAINHVWGRFGLDVLPEPVFAAAISFSSSAAFSLLLWGLRHKPGHKRLHRAGIFWGVCSGIIVFFSIWAMYTALNTGTVVVVSPVINTYPFFTLIIALLVRQERLSIQILTGVALMVGGVVLVGLR